MSKQADPRARYHVDPATSVLASKNLKFNRYNPSFKIGVSVRASFNPNHFFTLFMSIPYLGEPPSKRYSPDGSFKADASKLTEYREGYQPNWFRESLSLFEYRFQSSSRKRRRNSNETPEPRTGTVKHRDGGEDGGGGSEAGASVISHANEGPVNEEPVNEEPVNNGGPTGPRLRRGETIESGRKRDNHRGQDILVHQAWFIVLDNRLFPPFSFFRNIQI